MSCLSGEIYRLGGKYLFKVQWKLMLLVVAIVVIFFKVEWEVEGCSFLFD